jgi:putative hydrolase of the HAD superfamily
MFTSAGHVRAIVFDVDGTLYRQAPLRRAMALRLLRAAAMHPSTAWETFRALKAYRHAQERLRGESGADLSTAQIHAACGLSGISPEAMTRHVGRWMDEEPLPLLRRYIYPGTIELLDQCRAQGLLVAALSDYPADGKLRALGIADRFDVVICAQDAAVNVFKPHPRGLLAAASRLGVPPAACLYVGDRADVDAAAAAAAGMPCAIIGSANATAGATHRTVRSYRQLQDLLWGRSEPTYTG